MKQQTLLFLMALAVLGIISSVLLIPRLAHTPTSGEIEIVIPEAGDTSSTSEPSEEIPASSDVTVREELLVGLVWQWEKAVSGDGRTLVPEQPEAFSLTFVADGTLTGTTDCNSFFGSYKLASDAITFSPFGMTKMFCADSEEQLFVGLLSGTMTAVLTEARILTLTNPATNDTVYLRQSL